LRSPSSEEKQRKKHSYSPDEAIQEIEHARPKYEGKEKQLPLCAHDGEGAIQRPENGVADHAQSPQGLQTPKSQVRKFTARTAIPIPKTIPAKVRFAPPSPKAKVSPPITRAISASPFAMGPVNDCCSTFTAFSQGELACARALPAVTSITPRMTGHRKIALKECARFSELSLRIVF
jgi:hypothetical protein